MGRVDNNQERCDFKLLIVIGGGHRVKSCYMPDKHRVIVRDVRCGVGGLLLVVD